MPLIVPDGPRAVEWFSRANANAATTANATTTAAATANPLAVRGS